MTRLRALVTASIISASILLPAALPAAPDPAEPAAVSVDRAKEQAALELLRLARVPVSGQSLDRAVMDAETGVVAALLDAGVDPNGPGMVGPPLSEAVSCEVDRATAADRLATVEALLAHGANADFRDSGGNSILMRAVSCPPAVTERLLAAGAKIEHVSEMGYTALHHALIRGHWDVADLLVQKGARVSQESVDQIFFEMPTDPGKLAILARATGSK